MSSLDKLIYMANQIARNLETEGDGAATMIAQHIISFWDPRMKAMIMKHMEGGGGGLSPLAHTALIEVQKTIHA